MALDDLGQDTSLFCALFSTFIDDTSFHEGLQDVKCLLQNTFSGLFLLLAFNFFGVNWHQDTDMEGTGQRYPHSRNTSIIFSYFENNSFFYSQLVKMVAPGGVPRDGDQTMDMRMKKMKPQVSEMHTGDQEIRHTLRREEFCHHATETMLEMRSVHCHFTASLGCSYLWKTSY